MIRAIIVEPDEMPEEIYLDGETKTYQELLKGNIEEVQIAENVCILCNEDGRILNLEINRYIKPLKQYVYGTFIIVGCDSERYVSIENNFNYNNLFEE